MHVVVYSHFVDKTWEGQVPEMKLEELFRFFNRVTEDDALVLESLGYDLPSLSSGDTVWVNGFCFECAPVGWERQGYRDRPHSAVGV